ncbi:MAG: hypothetical protein MK096_01895 [Oleiphilaceae bacterium]|nr:hypothetical protein [Oleiphilaceae bacterium]
MKTKIILSAVSLALVAGLVIYSTSNNTSTAPEVPVASTEERLQDMQAKQTENVRALPDHLKKREMPEADELVIELSKRMREEFANNIEDIVVQVRLRDLLISLEQDFPGQGRMMFEQIVRAAFPELADQIIAAVDKMGDYEDWLVDSYLDLEALNAVAKDNTIWNKRIEIFGESDARKIWNEQVAQEEQRERNVKVVLNELSTDPNVPMEERIYLVQSAMEENYGDTPAGLMMGTASVTTQLIFRMDAVQQELAGMDPEARQETINQMRLQLGFPEERIAQLEEEDQRRDEQWTKGYAYMEARTALLESYTGEDLETELDILRLTHFDDRTAYSLKQEETIGMMRFDRPRVYGMN